MISFDHLLFAATLISGLMSLGYALFRHGSSEEKRKIIKFWLEIFSLCSVLLVVRLFYTVFPAVPPDKFFLGCTLLAGAFYGYFKIVRHNASEEKKKVIKLCRDAFLCLLLVFVFRGFFYDWFRIPSNSMQPTLLVGDLVLTDKNRYGYRLPLFNTRLTPGTAPARGDIIVFKKPGEELFYIKRIVGIPGDMVRYGDDKSLAINGEALPFEITSLSESKTVLTVREQFAAGGHDILISTSNNNLLFRPPDAEHCSLNQSSLGYILNCKVPAGHYFVLGDNRDHSNDSRFWGFVPEENIVGPASRVMFNHRFLTAFDTSQLQRLWLSLALETK